MLGNRGGKVLVVGDPIVQRAGGKLQMKPEARVQLLVQIQPQPVTAANVLQRAGNVVPGAGLNISPKAEVSAELEATEILQGAVHSRRELVNLVGVLLDLGLAGGSWRGCRRGWGRGKQHSVTGRSRRKCRPEACHLTSIRSLNGCSLQRL